MREKLRCAVIGVGAIGIEHLNSLLHCPRAATVAIAELNPQRLREAAEKFHIPRSYSKRAGVIEPPGPNNSWRHVVLRVFGKGPVSIVVRWWPRVSHIVRVDERR